jgi:hypothetical protein
MRTKFVSALVLALVACKSDPRPAAPPPTTSPASAEPASVVSTPSAPGSQNLTPLAGLANRLHDESKLRPPVKVPAETLFAALTQRGIALASQKQVLAATAQAAYCALGVTKENIALAVCEYESAAAARAGKQLLDTRYAKLVPDAVRKVNGSTLLTIANTREHVAIRDQVLDTFTSL